MTRPVTSDTARIAVVGMAGRFPGAPDVDAFWRNLHGGVESISFYSNEELREMRVDPAWLNNPNFIPARPHVEGRDLFDAGFFGYSAQEAEIIDPQQRLFLETAWASLEHAGYVPDAYDGLVGIYAGSSQNTYLWFNLLVRPGFFERHGMVRTVITNGADYLSTRTAYKLNLRGPSVTVQTACSTSLVAIHLACQALLNFECDMALAGGASLRVTPIVGYLYESGGLLSRDGHCRAFDAKANGTLFGDGVGVVVLKRLEDAIEDGDTIHAVILGSAVNNDGSHKAGFTAPAPAGQAAVVFQALETAGVSADTISYVEAHGTGTDLGDPIEVSALSKAFRASTDRRGFCAIGSVKTNIGHLDAAAGVAGLIKTVLALEHREIPASLHFSSPNPGIDFAASPFFVNAERRPWTTTDEGPRRAGVSAFGIGGTNAHIVLEEAPPAETTRSARRAHVLVVSARTDKSLDQAVAQLAAFLAANPDVSLADVAYTLSVGRRAFPSRVAIVARSIAEAADRLSRRDTQRPADADAAFDELLPLAGRWTSGADIDWPAHWRGERRKRIPLPTYAFDRQRYWSEPFGEAVPGAASLLQPATASGGVHHAAHDVTQWFQVPIWRQSAARPGAPAAHVSWLVIADEAGFAAHLFAELQRRGDEVVVVSRGDAFASLGADRFSLRLDNTGDYVTLLDRLRTAGRVPTRVVCAAAVRTAADDRRPLDEDAFFVPLALLQALATATAPISIAFVTTQAYSAIGDEGVLPDGALAGGISRVAGRELPNVTTRVVDLPLIEADASAWPSLAQALVDEFDTRDGAPIVAYRHGRRWIQDAERVEAASAPNECVSLRDGGTYLITGGFGGLGLTIATALAERVRPRLLLAGRRAPDPEKVRMLEAAGATVHVITADVGDVAAFSRAIASARASFGRIDGVIHAAGVAGGGLLVLKTRESAEAVLRPKVAGTRALLAAVEDDFPDFVVLFSSIAGITGDVGQADYAAANAWLDAVAHTHAARGRRVLSINWDAWQEVGMAVDTAVSASLRDHRAESVSRGIAPAKGVDAFFRALAQPVAQIVVSPVGLAARLAEAEAAAGMLSGAAAPIAARHPRPELATPHVPPSTAAERRLAVIWEDLLGADGIGIDDNFFELGGDSLLATQLIARVRTAFGRDCSLREVMEQATIAALASTLDVAAADATQGDEAQLLAELAGLSEEEAEARLRALLNPPRV